LFMWMRTVTQSDDGRMRLSQRSLLQSVEHSIINGVPTQRRPGQRWPQAQQAAPAPAPSSSQPSSRAPAGAAGTGRRPTSLVVGDTEKALVRSCFQHDLAGDGIELRFKAKLLEGGIFNGRRVQRRSETAANQIVARFHRGMYIAVLASDRDPSRFQPPKHSLFDFLLTRIPQLRAGGNLEALAFEQGWCNRPQPGTSSACNDQANAMQAYVDMMFADMQQVRMFFPEDTNEDADSLYRRGLIEGIYEEGMTPVEAHGRLAMFYRGAALLVTASHSDTGAWPLKDSLQETIREHVPMLQGDAPLAEWAMHQRHAEDADQCSTMAKALTDYVEIVLL